MRRKILIRKLSANGDELVSYQGEVIERGPDSITIKAIFARDGARFGTLEIERGDQFIETFYEDRWYNVFEIRDGKSNRLKGWYCNIARPARIEDNELRQEDLALDFAVDPVGRAYVFDRAEFEELHLSGEEREQALSALAELQEQLRYRRGPFQPITDGRP